MKAPRQVAWRFTHKNHNHAYTLTVVGLLLGATDGDELGNVLGATLGVTVGAPVGGCVQGERERARGDESWASVVSRERVKGVALSSGERSSRIGEEGWCLSSGRGGAKQAHPPR